MAKEVQHMPTRIREALVGTALLALICIAGCEHKPAEQGVVQGGASWQSSATNPVPGIDEASVTFITLKAGPPQGVPFVVWSDLPNGTSGSGGGSAGGASYEGHHSATNGRRVEFRAKTTDGKSGSITIAGVDYDLAKGSLFLVSTRNDPPKVAQITFDLSGFPKGDALKDCTFPKRV
jgi:hypothetical protein